MICSSKVEKLQEVLKKKKLDGAVILNYVDIFYFSGTIQGNLLFIPAQGTPRLFARRAAERASREMECGEALSFKSFKEVKEYLPSSPKLGFLLDVTPVQLYQKILKDLEIPEQDVMDLSLDLRNLKMVKTPEEIEKIRRAGKMIEKSYLELAERIHPGMTELEVALELEYILRRNGHLGENRFRAYNQIGLYSYVVSGSNVTAPVVHETPLGGQGIAKAMGVGPGHRVIAEGEPFMVDTVGNFEGYHNDNTRTFIFGKPSDRIKKHYSDLLEIYHFILSLLKPGRVCEQIYIKVLEKAKHMGYEEHFMGLGPERVPFLGHGIGIEVDEFPVFAKRFNVDLQPGMTVALEPKLLFQDIGGVGIESTFLITEQGYECLSPLKEEIFSV